MAFFGGFPFGGGGGFHNMGGDDDDGISHNHNIDDQGEVDN